MLRSWKKRQYKRLKSILLLIVLSLSITAYALPDIPSFNDCPDIVFNSSFQNDSQPSNGAGGEFPGVFSYSVFSNGELRTYYVSIPPQYNPNKPLPLLFSWHGAAGAGTAQQNAELTRNFWKPVADLNNFIVLTQAGTGSSGGGFTFPNDIILLSDILDDVYDRYNIELKRVYGHGFSSGGHLMHTLMLFYNNNRFPGYSVSAGTFADAVFEDPDVPDNSPVVPVFVSIGNSDSLLNTVLSEKTKFLNAGWIENQTYWIDIFTGGHELDVLMPQKSWNQLCTLSIIP